MKKLRDGIKRDGLVQPIVWNRSTGNIVGGHQRIAALDQLEKTQDYELDVAVVDMSLEKEKQINVRLNNPSVMGNWDLGLLESLLSEHSDNAAVMGFDKIDLEWMFDQAPFTNDQEGDTAKDARSSIEAIKARKIEARGEMAERDREDFYLVVVFDSAAQMNGFLDAIKCPHVMRYIDGARLAQDLGLTIQADQIVQSETLLLDTLTEREGA